MPLIPSAQRRERGLSGAQHLSKTGYPAAVSLQTQINLARYCQSDFVAKPAKFCACHQAIANKTNAKRPSLPEFTRDHAVGLAQIFLSTPNLVTNLGEVSVSFA